MKNVTMGFMDAALVNRDEAMSILQEFFPDTYEKEWKNLVEQEHIIEKDFLGENVLIGYKPNYVNVNETRLARVDEAAEVNLEHNWKPKYKPFMYKIIDYYEPALRFFQYWE